MGNATITALRPLLRYSHSRNAYILRVVGARTGPVLQPRAAEPRFVRDADRETSDRA